VSEPTGSGPGSARILVLATVALATAVSQSFGRFTYSLLFTDVRDDLGISNTAAGTIGSANLVAYLTGSLAVSMVVGRLGQAAVTRIGIAGVTAGLGLLAWGPGTGVVAAALFLTGFAAAGVWLTVPSIATDLLGPQRRGAAMGVVGAGVGLGIVAASLLDTTLGDGSFRTVYGVEALCGVTVTVLVVTTMRSPAPVIGQRLNGLRELRRVPRWGRLLTEYGLFAFAMALVMTFTVALLEEDAGLGSATSAAAYSLLGVGILLGGPIFGPMTDRLGRLETQSVALVTMAVSTLVITTGHQGASLVGAFAFGISFTGGPVTIGTRITDHLSGDAFSAGYGIATIAFGAGLAAGPQVGGLLADLTGAFRPALWTSAACATAALVLTLGEREWATSAGRRGRA
jgi:predicted MFS family arabinose efflux permease